MNSNSTLTPSTPRSLLLWISFLSFIAIGLQGGALGVAWLSMEKSFDKTLESLGTLLLAATVGGLIISFYGGRFIALLGLGGFNLLGSGLLGVGLLATGLVSQWSLLVVAAFAAGVGQAAINTGVNTFAANHYPSRQMNWLHTTFGIGSTLGPLLVTFIVIDLNLTWRISYVVLAAVAGVLTLLFLITLKEWRLKAQVTATKNAPTLAQTLKLPAVRIGTLLFILLTGIQLSTGQLSSTLFVEGRGIDPRTAGIWVSLFWAFITIGRLIVGTFIDRLGVVTVLRFCTFGTILGTLLLWLNVSPLTSFVGLAVMGFTLAPMFPTLVSRTPALVGSSHSPNAIGIQMAGATLGQALLPAMVGYAANRFGLELIPLGLIIIAVLQFATNEALSRQERQQVLDTDQPLADLELRRYEA